MSELKMSDMFNPSWHSVDYQNGVEDNFGNRIEFLDMHEIEKKALCLSINSHDSLIDQLAAAKAEIADLHRCLDYAHEWLGIDSDYKGSLLCGDISSALAKHKGE